MFNQISEKAASAVDKVKLAATGTPKEEPKTGVSGVVGSVKSAVGLANEGRDAGDGDMIPQCCGLSTAFLIGGKRQLKTMCARKRIVATLIYLISLSVTLIFAIAYKGSGKAIICILLIIIQFSALVWYTASYIPFAQDAIKKVIGGVFNRSSSS